MRRHTQYNPNVCLTVDDLEAIQTIYPDCEATITTPICYRVSLNLGLVRMAAYVLVPMLVIFIVLILMQSVLQNHNRQELVDAREEASSAARSSVLSKFKLAKAGAKEQARQERAEAFRSATRMNVAAVTAASAADATTAAPMASESV